jgi:malate permease and related proteins
MPALFGAIFLHVLVPILAIVALGGVLQRFYPLHMPTLSRLNIQIFVPVFLFVEVFESQLSFRQIGGILGASLLPMALLGLPLYFFLRRRGSPAPTIAAVVIGGVVFNAGNFGLPVAALFYDTQKTLFPGMGTQTDGVAVQALVVMMSNLAIWFLGYGILAASKGRGLAGILGYFKLPMIYVILAAFVLRGLKVPLDKIDWIAKPLHWLAGGYVPLALITLGAQLGERVRWPRWKIVGPVMFVKLLALPAVTLGVVYALGMWPWPGVQLVIASAAHTAVNTLLLTLELDGDSDLAADCIFWTTLASALTVTAVMVAVSQLGRTGG